MLLHNDGWSPIYGEISPDGKRVAFLGSDPTNTIRVAAIDHGRPLGMSRSANWAGDFAWMPDSQELLVASQIGHRRDQLGIHDLNGALIRRVHVDRPFVCDETGMAVSPDGRYALVSISRPKPSPTEFDTTALMRVDLSTGVSELLTGFGTHDEAWPVYIDPTHIVLAQNTVVDVFGRSTNEQIVSLDLARGVKTVLMSDRSFGKESVRPGSPLVIFDRLPIDQSVGLWAIPRSGGAATPVVSAPGIGWPSLSPDGRWVLATNVGSPGSDDGLTLYPIQGP